MALDLDLDSCVSGFTYLHLYMVVGGSGSGS